jgi:hypothetical protein
MKITIRTALASVAVCALGYHVIVGWGGADNPVGGVASAATTAPATVPVNPDRDVFFGDLHVHTANSYDAYMLVGTKTTPDEAYKFARGETITYLGQPVRRAEPLDFIAVTDHSENLGVFNQLEDPKSAFSLSEIGKLAREGGFKNFLKIKEILVKDPTTVASARVAVASAWQRYIETANANNRPGKFTAFIGYEWSSMPQSQNIHRNIIFRGATAPVPFSSLDSENPEDLWQWLSKIRANGHEALTISHNANASNGLMYDWYRRDGRPIDETYAQMRVTNEPLAEVAQCKGASETHPVLSSNDEFAGFERYDRLLVGDAHSKEPGSYWRDGLGRGLVIEKKIGINPFKDGAAGGSDMHTGLSISSETANGGCGTVNLPGAPISKAAVERIFRLGEAAKAPIQSPPQYLQSSSALTAIWAESNTRDSLYAGMRRKETYATSGPRMTLRFFGGWRFPQTLLSSPNWVKTAYADGVPMGSDLPAAGQVAGPSFAIRAVKDPGGANLDRVQIVKVWLENGAQKERVFDAAWSGRRRIDSATGKLPAVGSTVDLKTGKYANSIGAAQLSVLWKDPTFRADQPAVYYARILEIPTPRWTTLRALQVGLPIPTEVPATIQERAWSSPIWYGPKTVSVGDRPRESRNAIRLLR